MTREQLIAALSDAAELEHDITCQYLFAAFSLATHPREGGADWAQLERVRTWKAELLRIARQEMAHHGQVCNLLIAIGGAPHFRRAAFPHTNAYCSAHGELELRRFDAESLATFAAYERAHATDEPGTIGGLYAAIAAGIQGQARVNPKLFIGPLRFQIDHQNLRIGEGQFDMDLAKVTDAASACALLDGIRNHDHHERLLAIASELEQMRREDPGFEPARAVAPNPATSSNHAAASVIEQPLTLAAARLFNGAYEAMTMMMQRVYGRSDETDKETAGLIATAFFPLMTAVIRPLGELLTQMPISDEPGSAVAGACFEFPLDLPPQAFKRSAWVFLHERLQQLASACVALHAQLRASPAPWAEVVEPRVQLLTENLERIANNFERRMDLRPVYVRHMLGKLI